MFFSHKCYKRKYHSIEFCWICFPNQAIWFGNGHWINVDRPTSNTVWDQPQIFFRPINVRSLSLEMQNYKRKQIQPQGQENTSHADDKSFWSNKSENQNRIHSKLGLLHEQSHKQDVPSKDEDQDQGGGTPAGRDSLLQGALRHRDLGHRRQHQGDLGGDNQDWAGEGLFCNFWSYYGYFDNIPTVLCVSHEGGGGWGEDRRE